jgi:hypothetical protein
VLALANISLVNKEFSVSSLARFENSISLCGYRFLRQQYSRDCYSLPGNLQRGSDCLLCQYQDRLDNHIKMLQKTERKKFGQSTDELVH